MSIEPTEETKQIADDLVDDMNHRLLAKRLRTGEHQRDFAMVAASITEDRYSAGSTAARATIFILLTHGLQKALDFMVDLEHHES